MGEVGDRGHEHATARSAAGSSSSRPTPPTPSGCSPSCAGSSSSRPAGPGVKLTDETYDGTTITTSTCPASARSPGPRPRVDVPGGLQLAYAVTDEVVVLGTGADFVKGVLDARVRRVPRVDRPVQGRAGPRRQASTARCSGSTSPASATSPRPACRATRRLDYEADLKPYLDAFDSVIATNVPGDDIDKGTLVLSVTGRLAPPKPPHPPNGRGPATGRAHRRSSTRPCPSASD